MPKISMLVPTRDRPLNIERLIKSIIDTAHDLNNLELLFACDDDDATSMYCINQLTNKYSELSITYFYRPRSEWLNRDYFNWLVDKAQGDYMFNMGDDLVFKVKDWDKIILDGIDNFFKDKKDKIVYVCVGSDTPNPPGIDYKFTGFPIISKEAINILGFFLIPDIPGWCSDYAIVELYNNKSVNRVLDLDCQFVSHISSHTQAIQGDNITYRMGLICNKYQSPVLAAKWKEEKLPGLIEKLANHIRSKNG